MKTAKTNPIDYSVVKDSKSPEDSFMSLWFKEGNGLNYTIGADGKLLINIRANALPPFNGEMFNSEFINYIQDCGLSHHAVMEARDAAFDAIQRRLIVEALVKAAV
jgi:hypothetical protein